MTERSATVATIAHPGSSASLCTWKRVFYWGELNLSRSHWDECGLLLTNAPKCKPDESVVERIFGSNAHKIASGQRYLNLNVTN